VSFAPISVADLLQRDLDKLFNDYNVQENIDTLHKIVTEAKERNVQSLEAKDAWKPDLDPKIAVAARTIPVLNSEAQRLRVLVAEVCSDALHRRRSLKAI
jgi:hypothetical protein